MLLRPDEISKSLASRFPEAIPLQGSLQRRKTSSARARPTQNRPLKIITGCSRVSGCALRTSGGIERPGLERPGLDPVGLTISSTDRQEQ